MESRIMDWSKQHVIYFKLNFYSEHTEHWSTVQRERNNNMVDSFGFNDNATF